MPADIPTSHTKWTPESVLHSNVSASFVLSLISVAFLHTRHSVQDVDLRYRHCLFVKIVFADI